MGASGVLRRPAMSERDQLRPPSVVRRAAPAPSPDVVAAPVATVLAMAMQSPALGHDNEEIYRRLAKLWVYQLAPPLVVEANC